MGVCKKCCGCNVCCSCGVPRSEIDPSFEQPSSPAPAESPPVVVPVVPVDAVDRLDAGEASMRLRCAEYLADEVDVLIRRKIVDSRSPAADALLDYRSPPSTPRSDRLAALENLRASEAALREAARDAIEAYVVYMANADYEPGKPTLEGAIYALRAALGKT